nr:hypothetical protein [Burkholderia ubonensis]
MDALAPPTPNDANPWRGLLAHFRRRVRDERRLAAGRERADVPPQLGEPMPRERRDAHVVRREHAFQQRTFVAPVRRSVARSESRPHRSMRDGVVDSDRTRHAGLPHQNVFSPFR